MLVANETNVTKNTWRLRETVRWILGAVIGLGGLRLIGDQHWPAPISFIVSGIITILAIIVVGYGPKTYAEYCERQKKLE